MGRKPIGDRFETRLPATLRDRIVRLVGLGGVAGFLREAAEREATRRERVTKTLSRNPDEEV